MRDKLTTIHIRGEGSLKSACDLLHDASFDSSDAEFEADAGEWKGVFRREFHDTELVRKSSRRLLVLFKRYQIPLVESELRLSGVRAVEIKDRSRIGSYTFNEVSVKGNQCRMIFCEDMEVILSLRGGPRGELRDIRLLEERRQGCVFWPFPLLCVEW